MCTKCPIFLNENLWSKSTLWAACKFDYQAAPQSTSQVAQWKQRQDISSSSTKLTGIGILMLWGGKRPGMPPLPVRLSLRNVHQFWSLVKIPDSNLPPIHNGLIETRNQWTKSCAVSTSKQSCRFQAVQNVHSWSLEYQQRLVFAKCLYRFISIVLFSPVFCLILLAADCRNFLYQGVASSTISSKALAPYKLLRNQERKLYTLGPLEDCLPQSFADKNIVERINMELRNFGHLVKPLKRLLLWIIISISLWTTDSVCRRSRVAWRTSNKSYFHWKVFNWVCFTFGRDFLEVIGCISGYDNGCWFQIFSLMSS